jgi:hypothetical protein
MITIVLFIRCLCIFTLFSIYLGTLETRPYLYGGNINTHGVGHIRRLSTTLNPNTAEIDKPGGVIVILFK